MDAPAPIRIRAAKTDEIPWIERLLTQAWGSTTVVSRGTAHDASRLPALLALQGDQIVGLATFRCDGSECELVTLDALGRRQGIGSALLAGVRAEAVRRGCRRLWLITTNDNLDASR
ncbi:MAG TPA: GNAT family N-acetyltransferase, partial [Solirubrobacteraceae bacterium]|nr:GNAT family N-acetyltransferase [Solirubrobacteraceae bacterium]